MERDRALVDLAGSRYLLTCKGESLVPREVFSILAVCTGNVCRSPAVERQLINELGKTVSVSSAGTHALLGHPISEPMAALLRDRGIEPDKFEARQLTEQLLGAIQSSRARVVVIDITGVATVDLTVANHLVQTVEASRLMGASVIITGLSSRIAQTIVDLDVDLTMMRTVGDLQGGLEEAERLLIGSDADPARSESHPALNGQ